jgi:hypothetical protein
VQNTLQFLASLLHLLRSEPDRDADDVLSEFGSRLRSMADVTRYFDSLVQSTTTELDDHVAGMLTNLLCPGHTFTLPEDDPIVRSDVAMRMLSLVYELSLVIHFVDPAAELHVMIRVDDEQLSFDARTSVDRSEVTRIVDVGGLGGPVARSDPREAFVDSQPTDAGVVLRFRFPATGEQQPDRNHEAGSA